MRRLIAALLILTACRPSQPTELTFGFTPAEDAKALAEKAEPLLSYLGRELGVKFTPQTASDYAAPIEALRSQKLDIALLGPKATLMAANEAQAQVIARTINGEKPSYYSIVFARTDSGIKHLADLKNKSFAFVDVNSASGHLFPRYLLAQQGLVPERDLRQVLFAGAHDAVILAVLNGKVDAGATWSNDPQGETSGLSKLLTDPQRRRQLTVLGASPPIPGEGIVTRSGLDDGLRRRLQAVLVGMGDHPEGRAAVAALSFTGFVPSTSADYSILDDVAARTAETGKD